MTPAWRCLLIDDEPLALDRLARLLADYPGLEIQARITRPSEAVQQIDALMPDLIFLDVQMPGLTGFEMLKLVRHQPLVVFVTAYDRYALDAFEANSIDYLVKPVTKERLARCMAKLTRLLARSPAGQPAGELEKLLACLADRLPKTLPKLTSRTGDRLLVVEPSEVAYFHAENKYTFAVTAKGEYILDHTLQQLREWLPPGQFLPIHRSYIVNLDWIAELARGFGGGLLCRLKPPLDRDLPVSRSMVAQVRQHIQF